MVAAAYGLPPDYFDHWDVARFERELEIFAAIRSDGETPLSNAVFLDALSQVFGSK